jgi:NADH-quinone oxidoreductase subunit G
MYAAVGEVLKALADEAKAALHEASWIDALDVRASARAIAAGLAAPGRKLVLLGNQAMSHPQAAGLRTLAARIAEIAGATLGFLPEANGAGAWLAGCVPHRGPGGAATGEGGLAAQAMLRSPRKAYLLMGIEPELDILDAPRASSAMESAEFVVMLSAFKPSVYRSRAVGYADVLLPIAPFSETDGTFVNAEGRRQPFEAATRPLGEARPAWKILRVLANQLDLPGFGYTSLDEVRAELGRVAEGGAMQPGAMPPPARVALADGQLARIAEVPIYAVDPIVRRAVSLQTTADNPIPAARINATEAARRKLEDGDTVDVHMAEGEARLPLVVDARVPNGCVLIPSGYPETATLGPAGPASLERAS